VDDEPDVADLFRQRLRVSPPGNLCDALRRFGRVRSGGLDATMFGMLGREIGLTDIISENVAQHPQPRAKLGLRA
jgi:hypothetical protein